MNSTTLFVLCGLPGSGKTTWAKWKIMNNIFEGNDPGTTVIISSDDIRKELYGDASFQGNNAHVFDVAYDRVKEALASSKSVIFDATQLSRWSRKQVLHAGESADRKVCVVFHTLTDVCFSRNKNRDRVVPNEVMKRMANKFKNPSNREGFDFIFHMDGFNMNPWIIEDCHGELGKVVNGLKERE